MKNDIILELKNVKKSFGDNVVVENFNLYVKMFTLFIQRPQRQLLSNSQMRRFVHFLLRGRISMS